MDVGMAVTVRPGWFTSRRYGGPGAATASLVAFVVLVLFAGYTIVTSAYLMSNACFDDTGQLACPATGPDWARPLPGAAASLGLLVGLGGLLAGRPVRGPALVAGFVLTAAGLACRRLIG